MGKFIYEPKGKAQEYAKYAANAYKGCSGQCSYCYLKKGITAKVLGGNKPVLKSCFKDEEHAYNIFNNELQKNWIDIKKHGLFFSFTSDFLPETKELIIKCVFSALAHGIPVKLLTKQTDWITVALLDSWIGYKHLIAFGFTLTGHDELEPNCASNLNRIYQMKQCHELGFKTFASIEPIVDLKSSFDMIRDTNGFCDLYKIGLQSGKKYDKYELYEFVSGVINQCLFFDAKIYFKDSLLKQAGIERKDLINICVERNYNIFL